MCTHRYEYVHVQSRRINVRTYSYLFERRLWHDDLVAQLETRTIQAGHGVTPVRLAEDTRRRPWSTIAHHCCCGCCFVASMMYSRHPPPPCTDEHVYRRSCTFPESLRPSRFEDISVVESLLYWPVVVVAVLGVSTTVLRFCSCYVVLVHLISPMRTSLACTPV